jgi:hypothetical protein
MYVFFSLSGLIPPFSESATYSYGIAARKRSSVTAIRPLSFPKPRHRVAASGYDSMYHPQWMTPELKHPRRRRS